MKVGSLVICINDKNPFRGTWFGQKPINGNIYTIESFVQNGGVHLEELNPIDEWGFRVSYKVDRFIEIQPPMEIKLSDLIPENQYA